MTTSTKQQITLHHSVSTVTEFVGFALNFILHQRNLYTSDCFEHVRKYQMNLPVAQDAALHKYFGQLLTQVGQWIAKDMLRSVVCVLFRTSNSGAERLGVVERWSFDLESESQGSKNPTHKSDEATRQEVRHLLGQMSAASSFLPPLDHCVFDVEVHASTSLRGAIPVEWQQNPKSAVCGPISEDGNKRNAKGSVVTPSEVLLGSFSTTFHRVRVSVSFVEFASHLDPVHSK